MRLAWLICTVAPLFADVTMLNQGIYGPERVTAGSYLTGSNPQVILSHWFGWRTTFKITSIDPNTDIVTMPGNNFPEGQAGYFATLPGGVLPTVANRINQYKLVDKVGDTFRIMQMGSSEYVDFGKPDEWRDTVFAALRNVYDPAVSPHVYMRPGPLPQGLTLVAVENSCRMPAALTGEGYQNYNGAGVNMCYVVEVAPNTPHGSYTLTFNTHCTSNPACQAEATFQLEVTGTAPMGVVRPTSFPAIPGLRVWEEAIVGTKNQSAKFWCNIDNGQTKYVLGYGDMGGIWYYDGGKTYAQIAAYLKDFRFNRCAQTIDNFFADTWLTSGNPGAGYKATSFGVMALARTGNMKGNDALTLAFDPERKRMDSLSNGQCPTTDCMRETAYGIQMALTYSKAQGWERFQEIPIEDSTKEVRHRFPRLINQALGQLVMTRGNSPTGVQTYMIGLLLRELITWYSYSGDNRIIRAVKEELDWLKAEMYNKDTALPNEVAWNRFGTVPGSKQGNKCEYRCFPAAMESLAGLLLPAWGWLWSVTADAQYLRDGDTMFLNYVQKYLSYFFSGKEFNQGNVWMFNYVWWRKGEPPMYP